MTLVYWLLVELVLKKNHVISLMRLSVVKRDSRSERETERFWLVLWRDEEVCEELFTSGMTYVCIF